LALLLPLFWWSYLLGYSVPFFQLLIFSVLLSNFLFTRSPFYWLQLLSSVFAPTLTLRSLSLLFCSLPEGSGQKVLCSARFILPVTGNWRYSEFLFHPCLYICNSLRFLQYCYCFMFQLAQFRALLQLYTLCIERLSVHLHEFVALLLKISTCFSAVRSSSSLPKLRSGFTTLPMQWGGLCSSFHSFSEDLELLRSFLKFRLDCSRLFSPSFGIYIFSIHLVAEALFCILIL
jgi:hypothetical protein